MADEQIFPRMILHRQSCLKGFKGRQQSLGAHTARPIGLQSEPGDGEKAHWPRESDRPVCIPGPLPGDEDANIHLDEREGEREAPQEGRQELRAHPLCPVPGGRLTSTVLCKPHNTREKKALLFILFRQGGKKGSGR